jgi:hypothetical protein
MARRRITSVKPERPKHSIEQKRLYANRLKKRIEELEDFDHLTVQRRDSDPRVMELEAALDQALSAAFGHGTAEYNLYSHAAQLDHGPRIMRIEPSWISARGGGHVRHHDDTREAQEYVRQGKEESLALLWRAVKTLEEEIEEEQQLIQSIESRTDEHNMLKCNETITVERQDGSRYEDVRALVSGKMIFIPDPRVPIAPNDAILRQLPSGLVERLVVTDPGFYAGISGIPAHYQVKYRREGQEPAGRPGYVVHVSGNNSRVNIQSTDNSTNSIIYQAEDMPKLADEFAQLRAALLTRARSAEHYAAIGAVASAEVAAKEGASPKIAQALSALGAGGRWVVDTAKDIGVPLAVAALKPFLGLPPG